MENEINLENEKNQLFVERLKKKRTICAVHERTNEIKDPSASMLFLKFRWKMEMQDVDDKI